MGEIFYCAINGKIAANHKSDLHECKEECNECILIRNNNKTKQNNLFTVKQTNMALSKTKVQFLYNENENDLFAFFPEELANRVTRNKLSYSHIGQHCECSQEYADESREATKEEYLNLYHELTNLVGYDLQIVKR